MAGDLGLLMSDAMALACHKDRKTVTRRPNEWAQHFPRGQELDFPNGFRLRGAGTAKVGGRVWIRECWSDYGLTGAGEPWRIAYRAGGFLDLPRCPDPDHIGTRHWRWRPSIHMPKWAARTWGRIVSVRPERLQDITEDDARREGFAAQHPGGLVSLPPSCKAAFVTAWNELYEPRGLGWGSNPWVWRIEWERIERPEGVTR